MDLLKNQFSVRSDTNFRFMKKPQTNKMKLFNYSPSNQRLKHWRLRKATTKHRIQLDFHASKPKKTRFRRRKSFPSKHRRLQNKTTKVLLLLNSLESILNSEFHISSPKTNRKQRFVLDMNNLISEVNTDDFFTNW